jgi:hypothetical protein
MRAWRREMEENMVNNTELTKRMGRMESICSKALDVKKTVRELQLEVQRVQEKQEALEGVVTEATNRVSKLEDAQSSMRAALDVRYKESLEADRRLTELEKKAGIEVKAPHDSLQAFYLTGLGDLAAAAKKHQQRHSDPITLIRNLLRYLDLEQYMTRIHLINVTMTEAGREARSAVIFMTSAFHKNEAIIRVKTFLRQQALHRVQAEDCFPPTQLEAVRALRSHGHRLKTTGEVAKYRVVNRDGVAVLQTGATTDGRYEDTPLPAEETRHGGREDGGCGRRERERSMEARGWTTASEEPTGERPEERRRRAPPAQQIPRAAERRQHRGSEAAYSEYNREARRVERQPPLYRESERYRNQQQHRMDGRRQEESHTPHRGRGAARDLYYAPPKGPVPVEYGGPRPMANRTDTRKAA